MPRRRNDSDPLRRHLTVRERGPQSWEWIYRQKGHGTKRGRETTEDLAWKAGLDHKQKIERGEKPYLVLAAETKTTWADLIEGYFAQVRLAEAKRAGEIISGKTPRPMYVYDTMELKKGYKNENIFLRRCPKEWPWLFKEKTLAHITSEDVKEFCKVRLQTIDAESLRREISKIKYVWDNGRRDFRLPPKDIFNDKAVHKRKKKGRSERRILKKASEYLAIYKAISTLPRLKTRRLVTMFVYTALQTAMRKGELLQSQWKNFDIEAKAITIPAEINKNNRTRTIPMTTMLAHRLWVYRNGLSEEERAPEARVFPIHEDTLTKLWREEITRQAGMRVAGRNIKESLELHALKHVALSNFEDEPINLRGENMARMADHEPEGTTPIYIHNDDIIVDRIRKKLEARPTDPEDDGWDPYFVEDFAFDRTFSEASEMAEPWPDIEFIKRNGRIVLDANSPKTKSYLEQRANGEAASLLMEDVRMALVVKKTLHGYETVFGAYLDGYLGLSDAADRTGCSPLSLLAIDSKYNGVIETEEYLIISQQRFDQSSLNGDYESVIRIAQERNKMYRLVKILTGEITEEHGVL